MKKIVYLFAAVLLFASCEKDEIGGTATEALAGQWYVHVDAVDENGDVVYSGADIFGLGTFMLLTYNTASNTADTLFVDDLKNFWDFKVKVSCNTSDRTFGNTGFADNYKYECGVKITDGKVLPQAATTPSGMPADSIVFFVEFDDDLDEDEDGNVVYVPEAYGFKNYRIAGYRYTGFTNDD